MTLKVDQYGGNPNPDTAVFVPYSWGGETHNNEALLRDVALRTGALLIGAQTPGTGRMYIDRATRKALRPGDPFAAMAEDYAYQVTELLDGIGMPTRVLAANSGRVALGARMQTTDAQPFTHALLRDGVILHPPANLPAALKLMGSQPAEGELKAGRLEEGPKTPEHVRRDKTARRHGIVEAIAQRHIVTSTEPIEAVEHLARSSGSTPVLHLTFARGIAGTEEEQHRFARHLEEIRADTPGGLVTRLVAEVVPGNHADLLNPALFAEHIERTVALSA
jgi:hypothetical protein